MKRFLLLTTVSFLTVFGFCQKKKADLLLHNAKIYIVDAKFSIASAMAVKDGKVLETGDTKKLLAQYDAKEKLDAKGAAVYPGFIDAHAHFLGYGLGLQRADLTGTESGRPFHRKCNSERVLIAVIYVGRPGGFYEGCGQVDQTSR